MAFKPKKQEKKIYPDIESLFRDLTSRKIETLYSHQADILRSYSNVADKKNIAIELPTGSGKTLVGLLIAQYRRHNNGERIVYLCPTKQLVNQVVIHATESYGIKATAFLGSKNNYSPASKSEYNNSETIAVTTYSSLFNINPFFKNPDLIIIDDAHASENYISSPWSLKISRSENDTLYTEIITLMQSAVPSDIYNRLVRDDADNFDKSIVELLPLPSFYELKSDLIKLLDLNIEEKSETWYSWKTICNNIDACNFYYSWSEILIRPLIPPSKTNNAFEKAKQRLFMSATLGNGGDLERLTGLKKIERIPIPKGWDKQGLGRRFFLFPEQNIEQDELKSFLCKLINKNKRTVLIVSSNYDESSWISILKENLPDYTIFSAKDIENGKDSFNNNDKSIVLLSNRFDGIDFKGDESRLLIIDKISNSGSLQEKFLQFKLNAGIIFFERNRTRLIQAIGRCTRSANDFAAVCILNGGISDWFIYPDKTQLFHPEIQGEIEFGIHQSKSEDPNNLIENFSHFINQTQEWREVETQIIEYRDKKEQKPIIGEKGLASSVKFEVQYMYALWDKDYLEALTMCDNVITSLEGGNELLGYKAFWNYLAGCSAWLQYRETNSPSFHTKALEYFSLARSIKPSFGILNNIISENTSEIEKPSLDNFAIANIENAALKIESIKIEHTAKFIKTITSISKDLDERNKIEDTQVKIGELLGFKSDKKKGSATPDPYWISKDSLVIVFEDKIYEDIDKPIPAADIRQALSHKNWIKLNVNGLSKDVEIQTVFLSNRKKINQDDKHTCDELLYWNYSDFVSWGKELLNLILSARNFYVGSGDYGWKEYLQEEFKRKGLFPMQILSNLDKLETLAK